MLLIPQLGSRSRSPFVSPFPLMAMRCRIAVSASMPPETAGGRLQDLAFGLLVGMKMMGALWGNGSGG